MKAKKKPFKLTYSMKIGEAGENEFVEISHEEDKVVITTEHIETGSAIGIDMSLEAFNILKEMISFGIKRQEAINFAAEMVNKTLNNKMCPSNALYVRMEKEYSEWKSRENN